jgi:polysaccharide export outer membrane protein
MTLSVAAALTLWVLPQATAAELASQPPRAASVQEYEIGAEDILRITVYGHNDLLQTVVVQSDGTFIFPLVGRIKAEGLTPKELEQKLAILLGEGFIRNPQVTVVVQEYRSKTVFVVGEVARPGSYPLSESRTVVEILSRAGPMLPSAGAEVVVVRPAAAVGGPVLPESAGAAGHEQAEVIRVNMRDIQSGDLAQNVTLRPHDTVFVPQAPKVYVSGEVRLPGAYPMAPGTTVRQAISLAGGFNEEASTSRIEVVRLVDGKSRKVKVKLDDAVQPGDTVVVKQKLF